MKNNKKSPAMTDSAMTESPLLGRGMGEASGYGPSPIRDREAFFKYLQKGLQKYFDTRDSKFDGVIYLTVGIRQGHVGGIIRSDDPFPFAPKEYIGDGIYVEKRRKRKNNSKV